ncbi:MAG: hypothetical protein HY914_22660 [Desulfomonile tiedjei]|nr:hypothetical protein [Desulfomonile tiedjei]
MDDAEIRELIQGRQANGRISCREAIQMAEEAGVSRLKIGRLLDDMKIKIHSCQLGCFK